MEATELCLEIPGVELASGFYRDFGRPALLSRFEPYMDRMTIGLVGEGSECFGFDDRLSMDHDYGPSFCIWLSHDLYEEIGPAVAQVYDSLPRDYKNVSFGLRREQAEGRRGVIPTLPFYQKFLGNKVPPESALEWLAIPESYLAVATNGALFHSPDTEFVRIRKRLLDFYPEDVCKKKLAANLVKMAHAGQVNYERMAKRGDPVAARLALDQFIEAAIRVLYLLNKQYCPYYKWMWRGLERLPARYGIPTMLRALAAGRVLDREEQLPMVEAVCGQIVAMLLERGYTDAADAFLERQAYCIAETIAAPQLRNLPILMG